MASFWWPVSDVGACPDSPADDVDRAAPGLVEADLGVGGVVAEDQQAAVGEVALDSLHHQRSFDLNDINSIGKSVFLAQVNQQQ